MAKGDDDISDLLTKVPWPETGTDEVFARGMIEMVLNATLNRYALALADAGFVKSRKFAKEGPGWLGGKPNKLLQVKFDIMDQAIEIFSPIIVSVKTRVREQYFLILMLINL